MQEENYDLENIKSPVNYENLERILKETNYDRDKTKFLVEGFKNGFDLGYRGPENIQQESKNLKFTIGNKTELWNKVMKEVKEKRYAGPYDKPPFDNYIQSPIGLVPKDAGKKTRLIFHLSHPRDKTKGFSINGNTPQDMTKVKYKKFDDAIRLCLQEGIGCAIAKSDMSSAFRHFGMAKKWWKFLVMKAQNPNDHKWYYFVDKCMPFGASISCAHFQAFSDAIAHVVTYLTKKENVNYLDDFFFVALMKTLCDGQVQTFLDVCEQIKFPVSMEKTFWSTTNLTFLGLLIDTVNQLICIPTEKIDKAKDLISRTLNKRSKKITLQDLQKLTGFLNFLCKAVVPGRAFTRRMYNLAEGNSHLRQHHHIKITKEIKADLELWLTFLEHPSVYARKFIDLSLSCTPEDIDFFTDASANANLGCGGISDKDWYIMQWNEKFIKANKPSINYLELYAVTVGIMSWIYKYKDRRVNIFCGNMSVVNMINSASSKCKNCMLLIRLITIKCLTHNVKVSAKHVPGKFNTYSDHLSRLRYKQFWQLAKKENRAFANKCTPIPEEISDIGKNLVTCNSKQRKDFKQE